ncbi:hypothetical protein Tco_1215994 [Tanacetum coccineum]
MIGDLWVEAVISVKGVPWVGDGGVSGVSLSVVSLSDNKNGEIAGNGGIFPDDYDLNDQTLNQIRLVSITIPILGDKSLDLSAFKLSRLFFGLLPSGSSSCWRSYGVQ